MHVHLFCPSKCRIQISVEGTAAEGLVGGGGYLNPGGGCEDGVIRVLQTLLFLPLRLRADEQVKVRGQVASQQCLAGRNVEQKGERLHVETRLQHLHKLNGTVRGQTYTRSL